MTDREIAESELAKLIFGLSPRGERLEVMIKGPNLSKDTFKKKRGERIFLPTNSLRYNGFESLDDLDSTPLYLVPGVHKSAAHGDYLPISMVRAIISVNKYLLWISLTLDFSLWSIWTMSLWNYICPHGHI